MGVFNSANLDFASIGETMAKTALLWMNAQIQIVDPNTEDAEWDTLTNEYIGGSATVLWSGPARIQHLNQSIGVAGFSETGIRTIRVQVPLDVDAGFLRKGLQVIVTDAGNDYELEQLQFVINSAINSSYAWLRTIECDVDVKSIANSTWASISGSVKDAALIPIENAIVRTFHHEDDQWLLDYETTTDVRGNYSIPADADVDVVVCVIASGYVTQYYFGESSAASAVLITPVNHEETANIDFEMVNV
jgi:Family of unknown function (DUF6093)